ncbi:MAG: Lpg1974 family pore-forming outer membrane protein [Chlamydiota bacterium]
MSFILLATASLSANHYSDYCDSCNHYNVYAEWLFFRAAGESVDVATISTGTTNDPDEPRVTSDDWKRIDVCPDWDSGYRLGFSTDLKCARLFGEWTWYATDKKTKFNFIGPSTDNQTFRVSSDFLGIQNNNLETYDLISNFHFSYYRLDIGLERRIIDCNRVSFSPFAAFTYYQTNQDLKAQDSTLYVAPVDTSETRKFNGKTQYNGFGASLGYNVVWEMFDCLALYSKGIFTAAYGSSEVNYDFNRVNDQFAGNDNTFHFSFDKSRGRYITSVQVGLRTETCICGCYQIFGMVGWESQILFDQTDWMVKTDINFPDGYKPSANLYLQGLVVRAGISF